MTMRCSFSKVFSSACGALAFGMLLMASDAGAVGTRTFRLDSGEDFKGGDLKGVAIDSVGKLRAGFNLGEVPVPQANAIWGALRRKDGSLLMGTGNEGKLLELRGGNVKLLAETKALVVTSLTEAWGNAVVMGTLPEGRVMKWEGGKLSELAKLKETDHVWQVAFDAKTNAVYAATGPQGKLWRIDRNGQAQVYFDAEEQHLMSVAVAPDGTVYAGSSDNARLYAISGPGRAKVLHDFGRTEVRAIAVAKDGSVYAVANEIKPGSYAPSRKSQKGGDEAGPTSAPRKTKGKGTLYRFPKTGAAEELLDDEDEHFVSLAIGDDGKPYVGPGVEGRVYTVDTPHNAVLVADTEERQVTALSLSGPNKYVFSSDPAVVHPVRGIGGTDAVWTSKVLDAGLRARFGKLTWEASGPLELSTRSGNTEEPDDTWSEWSRPLSSPGVVVSPSARYLQVRARWSRGKDTVLREVVVPFVTDNLRAVITSIDADSPAKGKEAEKAIEASGGPITDEPERKIKLSWKLDNPDDDELRFRLQYRMIGTSTWFDVLKPKEKLTEANYSWETGDLPEGRYRVRVIASDELSNPPGLVKRHQRESEIILVDNTAPSIERLTVAGRRLKGVVVDGVGPVSRIEVSVAGSDEWFPFYPSDGIFDEQREEFDFDIGSLSPSGAALVNVRAYDSANNSVVRHVTLK